MTQGTPKQKYCLATVTSESFVPGSLVMLHSFLKYNPWFDGDIVIIHDALPQRFRDLFDCFPHVRYLEVAEALKEQVDRLCRSVPDLRLELRKKRFYSLELFRLSGYDKALFCDSDILFLGNVFELFESMQGNDDPLVACGDKSFYLDSAIDVETYLSVKHADGAANSREAIGCSFNAGVMLVGGCLMEPGHYSNMLRMIDPCIWNNIKALQTDQIVYNLYFNGQCRLVGPQYNYLVVHDRLITAADKIGTEDIKVLHFNSKPKPWDVMRVMHEVSRPGLYRFIQMWNREYQDFLPEFHLRLNQRQQTLKSKGLERVTVK